MKIPELLREIELKFPKFPMAAWADTYRDTLEKHEGESLRQAWSVTLRGWSDFSAPKPAHIAANLPENEKRKSLVEQIEERDYARLKRVAERADRLYATALRESQIDASWEDHAKIYLRNVTRRVAEIEEQGKPLAAALTWVNSRDDRIACSRCRAERTWGVNEAKLCPTRLPDAWMDEHDAMIFAARTESQLRINPDGDGLTRGDDEPKWTSKKITNAVVEAAASDEKKQLADHRRATREKMRDRIPQPA